MFNQYFSPKSITPTMGFDLKPNNSLVSSKLRLRPLKFTTIAMLAITLLNTTGCAFNSVDPDDYVGKFRDRLQAEILEDGLKLFTYKARLANPSLVPLEERLAQDRPFGRSQEDYRDYVIAQKNAQAERELWVRQVELGLEKTLEMSGFCREGYHELNRFIDFDRAEIRGECKEGANDADRKKYPVNATQR